MRDPGNEDTASTRDYPGTVLFSVNVNDLPSVFKHCQSESYVDDTLELYISFSIQEWAKTILDIRDGPLKK